MFIIRRTTSFLGNPLYYNYIYGFLNEKELKKRNVQPTVYSKETAESFKNHYINAFIEQIKE